MKRQRRHAGGKPPAKFVQAALEMIGASRPPLSTRQLIKELGLGYSEGISLRRALRREAKFGRLLCVGKVGDGSFAWTTVGDTPAGPDRALLGAVLAAEAYLRDCLGREIALDIEACRQVIGATLSRDNG
jgi:hypothetical protein